MIGTLTESRTTMVRARLASGRSGWVVLTGCLGEDVALATNPRVFVRLVKALRSPRCHWHYRHLHLARSLDSAEAARAPRLRSIPAESFAWRRLVCIWIF
jgi:hypothetical protein